MVSNENRSCLIKCDYFQTCSITVNCCSSKIPIKVPTFLYIRREEEIMHGNHDKNRSKIDDLMPECIEHIRYIGYIGYIGYTGYIGDISEIHWRYIGYIYI